MSSPMYVKNKETSMIYKMDGGTIVVWLNNKKRWSRCCTTISDYVKRMSDYHIIPEHKIEEYL